MAIAPRRLYVLILLAAAAPFAAAADSPVAAALVAAAANSDSAQPEAAPDDKSIFNLGGMTVTAPTKTERLADETPGSSAALGREELEHRQMQDLGDALKYIPGVEVENGARRIGQDPNIRGLSGARVLQTMDGARMNFETGHKGATFFEPDWLQSIEVVRGPASALYGSGAIGGVLAMRTIEANDLLPDDKSFGIRNKFGFAYANEEYHDTPTVFGRIRLGEEQSTEQFTYLLSYSKRISDDIDLGGDYGRLDNSGDEIDAGLATFTYEPTEFTKFRFSTSHYNNDQDVPLNVSAPQNNTDNTLADRRTLQSFYNLQISHRDPVHTWFNPELLVYYNRMDLEEVRTRPSRRVDDVRFETFGFDLRNRHDMPLSDAHALGIVYGVEYYLDRQESRRSTAAVNGFFPHGQAEQISGYAQAELSLFNELLMLIPGIRFDAHTQESSTLGENEHNRVSPKIGGLIKLDDEIGLAGDDYLIFQANYAFGFRAPLFSELYPSGTHFPTNNFIPNPDLEPEKSATWEVGPRAKLGPVHFTAAYFQTRAEDFIEGIFNFGVFPSTLTFENVSKARIEGVEVSAEWEFVQNWLVSVGYSRIRGENLDTGAPITTIPADKVIVGLDHRIPDAGLSISLRVSNVFEQDHVPGGGPTSESYTVVDLFVTWTPRTTEKSLKWIEGFRFDFGIENMFNEGYTPYFAGVPETGFNPRASVTYTLFW